MHIKVIFRVFALLSLIVCLFMLPSTIMALTLGEHDALRGFAISYGVMMLPAIFFLLITKDSNAKSLSMRDGFFLVFSAWMALAVFSSIPFYFSGVLVSVTDAFFEGASGITTTGATVINNLENVPMSILLWRSVIHWMGGMGIIMLTVALLPLFGIGGLQLMLAEQRGVESSKLTSRVAQTAKYLWLIYVFLTFIIFVMFRLGGMSLFDSFNHAFSAMSSGGFSTKNTGISYYNSHYIQWVFIVAMFLAGTSFPLYFNMFSGKAIKIFKNTEFRAYLAIIISASVVIGLMNHSNSLYVGIEENTRQSLFHVVSLITSSGFAIADYTQWSRFCQFILFTLLFIGGCSGSTSGGFKVVRVVVILKQAIIELRHLLHPRGVFTLRLNGNTVSKDMVYSVSGFFILYIFTVVSVAIVASLSGATLETAFTSGLAIVGNTGAALGDVGAVGTYAFYPNYVKWVFGIAMVVGRLELYTFYVLLTPFFWTNK